MARGALFGLREHRAVCHRRKCLGNVSLLGEDTFPKPHRLYYGRCIGALVAGFGAAISAIAARVTAVLLGCAAFGCHQTVPRVMDGTLIEGEAIEVETYALYARGTLQVAEGELLAAEATFTELSRSHPDYAEVWLHLATLRCRRGAASAKEAFAQSNSSHLTGRAVGLSAPAACCTTVRAARLGRPPHGPSRYRMAIPKRWRCWLGVRWRRDG
jgi:hypothetical protein